MCAFALQADSISFDVRNKNIGFDNSPNPDSVECLLQQTFPGFSTTLYYNSAVEPSIAVNPQFKNYVIAAWQQDRFDNGGALDMGIARSEDGGKNWIHSTVPFQNCTGGFIERVTDSWLSYAADGSRVYLVVFGLNASTDPNTNNQEGIIVTTSYDNGNTWSIPHFISASDGSFESSFPVNDKCSVTADPSLNTYAYVVWDRFLNPDSFHSDTWFSRTTDGGTTWENSKIIYNPFLDPGLISNGIENDCQTIGNIVVGLPNGDLLTFLCRIYANPGVTDEEYLADQFPYQFTTFDLAVVRSTDKGDTWDTQATQIMVLDGNLDFTCGYNIEGGEIQSGNGELLRTGSPGLFSVAVNPKNGYLYVVVEDNQFDPVRQLPQIVLVTSRDGGNTWSDPVKVSRTPVNAPNPQAICPSVAVNKHGHVGVLYHDFRKSHTACTDNTKTNTWFALYEEVKNPNGGSTGVGLNFKKEVRVSEHSYIIENGPETGQGVMTNGDYNSLVVRKDDFHALYVQSHHGPFEPAQTLLDDIDTTGILVLDNNKRTSPFFSKIDA